MERITVDKDNLKLLIDDIDELASYLETLVNWSYDMGYQDGAKVDTATNNKHN